MSDENIQGEELTTEKLQAENEKLLNNWKRAAADLDNFKKRMVKERTELLEYGKEIAAMELLPSLQSLEQVLKFAPQYEKFKDWVAGLKATIQQLEKSMETMGLKKIKTTGEIFNPEMHEAVEEQETEGKEGFVVSELQPGFTLHNKVITPAKVVVGKNKAQQPSPRQELGE